jgi:hypothetical protein
MSFSYVLKAIGDKESKLDIYIKILINHMHLIVLTAFFGLSWPDLVSLNSMLIYSSDRFGNSKDSSIHWV